MRMCAKQRRELLHADNDRDQTKGHAAAARPAAAATRSLRDELCPRGACLDGEMRDEYALAKSGRCGDEGGEGEASGGGRSCTSPSRGGGLSSSGTCHIREGGRKAI